jgi:CheY-like chemotaxis protein
MGARVVLYVEDDDATFSLARITLEQENPPVELLRACSGEQALAILRNVPPYESAPRPDLILLDLNLPEKNGLEVLADLKANDAFRSIPVMIFSTSAAQLDRSNSYRLGARDFIAKPSDFDSFAKAVKRACSSS